MSYEDNRLGKIEISTNAIAAIAQQALLQTYGVVGLASRNVVDGIADLLTPDRAGRGVVVRFSGAEQALVIDLYVIVEYGTRISAVARSIQRLVTFEVEKALGVPVREVNVYIQGLRVSSTD
jgi:uncharacterized alkaline shock family protein YloU